MPEITQCDLRCPRSAYSYAEFRQETADASGPAGFMTAVALGVKGAWQAARAGRCPQRKLPEEAWQPSTECAQTVRAAIGQRVLDGKPPLSWDHLDEHEQEALGPYFGLGTPRQ